MNDPVVRPARSQRTNDRAHVYWDELRGGRSFPSPNDLTFTASRTVFQHPLLARHVFVVCFEGEPGDSFFQYGCPTLALVCGDETTGRRLVDCLPGNLGRSMVGFVKVMTRTPNPIAVGGTLFDGAGEEMLYRSIYLPLSFDQMSVRYLMGAFSFKELS